MALPLVSVVMCTYNGSKFIDEQIESILSQHYRNIELIISDDLSTDDTWKKLINWQEKDSRIKLYKNELNIGYNKNFEKAIQLASGEFIAISDQDDIWIPEKISELVSSFDDEVILSHNRSVRLENGRLRYKSASLHHHFKGNDTRRLFMFNQINGHDMMFRKILLQKALPIPGGMMYDWWLAVVATCYGKIASVNKYLVHHRIHAENSFFKQGSGANSNQLDRQHVLQTFITIEALSDRSRVFLTELLSIIIEHNKKEGFDVKLFWFLYKNGKIIFGHKRRWIPQVDYLKSAIKYAWSKF